MGENLNGDMYFRCAYGISFRPFILFGGERGRSAKMYIFVD